MANEVTMFKGSNVPAYVNDQLEGNIDSRSTVPSLSYEGKVWQIAMDGNKTKLVRKNADGDEEPVNIMRVVVLDYAKRRGRTYYEGDYDPKNVSAPKCWSEDGIAPDKSVPTEVKEEETSFKCETCPMAVKGSKVTNQGKAVTACSQHRMLAVVPSNKLDFQPLRLKIAVTSDWDKQSPDAEAQGWRAFSNYMDYLQSQGVKHSAALVTKIKFDTSAQYPKLFFAPDRWLTEEEVKQIAPIAKSDEVKGLLAGTWTPNGVDGTRKDEDDEDEQVTQEVETKEEVVKKTNKTTKPKAEKKPKKVKAEIVEDDEDEGEIVMKTDEPAEEPASSDELPEGMADLLANWTD